VFDTALKEHGIKIPNDDGTVDLIVPW
jgi:hypothetical protein